MPSIINATTTNGVAVSGDNSGSLAFQTNNGTTAVTINTSQNVGIGNTSPTTRLGVTGAAQFIGVSPAIFPTTGSGIEVVAGVAGQTNYIQAYDRTGSSWQNLIIGTGQTAFETSGNERMRLTSAGALCVGRTTSLFGTEKLHVYNTSNVASFWADTTSDLGAVFIRHERASGGTTGEMIAFQAAGGTTVGSIRSSGTATSYNTSSDYRLKQNVTPMTGALAKVAQLKPCTYTWKSTGEQSEGFIAHELAEVCPDAVSGEKDAVNEDGSIKPQGIDTSFLVATLTAAIQELKAELDATKAEVQALKGA